jgi:hypothetical protein
MDDLPPPSTRSHLSAEIQAVYGSYSWFNRAPIHYFLCNVSMGCLHSDILTMRDIPDVEKWGIAALFQREINDKWVEEIITKYIHNDNRLKFFPPITIALLPHEGPASLRLRDSYTDEFAFNPKPRPNGSSYVCAEMPGLEINFPQMAPPAEGFPPFGHFSRIQWDKSRFHAVAIDGQHRISALRKAWQLNDPRLAQWDVPSIILVFDHTVRNIRTFVQATREIFIDINRSSQRVDDSRLILLDDRRIHNAFTRAVLLHSYSPQGAPNEVKKKPLYGNSPLCITEAVPQELVDLRAGKNAFDVNQFRPWQITSAFIIGRAIQHFMFENDINKMDKLLEATSFKKDSSELYKREFAERRDQYGKEKGGKRKNAADDDMFAFAPDVAEALTERLINRHMPFVRGVFCGFSPYAQHIDKFKSLISGNDGDVIREVMVSEGYAPQSTCGDSVAAKRLKESDPSLYDRTMKAIATINRPDSWENDLSWYSVLQRALCYQPLVIESSLAEARGSFFTSRGEFAETYVDALNTLYREGFFVKQSAKWAGIVTRMNANNATTIDSSDAAAKRAAFLVRTAVCLTVANERRRNELIEKIGSKKGRHDKGFVSAASKVVDALANHLRTTAAREVTSEDARATAIRQLKALFVRPAAAPPNRSGALKQVIRRKRPKKK